MNNISTKVIKTLDIDFFLKCEHMTQEEILNQQNIEGTARLALETESDEEDEPEWDEVSPEKTVKTVGEETKNPRPFN